MISIIAMAAVRMRHSLGGLCATPGVSGAVVDLKLAGNGDGHPAGFGGWGPGAGVGVDQAAQSHGTAYVHGTAVLGTAAHGATLSNGLLTAGMRTAALRAGKARQFRPWGSDPLPLQAS